MTLPFAIPTLQTDRLTLREPRRTDLPAMTEFLQSDRARHVGGPYSDEKIWQGFIYAIGHWAFHGFGWWMLEDRATGAVAGRCGTSMHHGMTEPELGWHIYNGFEGKGYAHEAATAARAHANRAFGLGPLMSMIAPENTRSRNLAKRLGAAFERMGETDGKTCEIWRHPGATA